MKSLLVPVNFKECATNAAQYAADMALAMEADLHLLHVLEMPSSQPETAVLYIRDEMRQNAQWLLSHLSEDLTRRTHGQVTISVHLDAGGVEQKIEEYARRIQPFLVVMGGPEQPQTGGFFGGSDAITAVHHLSSPLLVVPDKQYFHAIKTITLACQIHDIKEGMPVSLAFLQELKAIFGAQFEVVHFTTGCHAREKEIIELYHWKQSLGEVIPELRFLEADTLEDGIVQYLATHNTDWMMIFPKKHGFLEFHRSRSRQIVAHCAVPVLSIGESVRAVAANEKTMA